MPKAIPKVLGSREERVDYGDCEAASKGRGSPCSTRCMNTTFGAVEAMLNEPKV